MIMLIHVGKLDVTLFLFLSSWFRYWIGYMYKETHNSNVFYGQVCSNLELP